MRDPSAFNGIFNCLPDMFLSNDIIEGLRTKPPGKNGIRCGAFGGVHERVNACGGIVICSELVE